MDRKRSGTYHKTSGGYEAFHPAPIPALSDLDIDDGLMTLLSRADRSVGRLEGISGTIPDPDLFVMMYVKKEAVLSSQIEGTQTSLMDVLEYEGRFLDPLERKDLPDVMNNIAVIRMGTDRIRQGDPLDLKMVRDLHSVLMKDARGGEFAPGEFRSIQNWIGSRDGTLNDAVFVPPPPEEIPGALADLESYMGRIGSVPPFIKAALVHAWFESIHPFLDGNGRMGRLIITLVLIQEGYLTRPLLYLSHYFKRNRSEYYDRLQDLRDRDAVEEWLAFFLKGTIRVSDEAYDKTLKITDLKERSRVRILSDLGRSASMGIRLLDDLFVRPVTNVNAAVEATGLSFPSANRLVSQLVGSGILSEVTGQKKNRVYEFIEYMDILEE